MRLQRGEVVLTSELANVGHDTADAALQTLTWAAVQQDAALLTEMIRVPLSSDLGISQGVDWRKTPGMPEQLERIRQELVRNTIEHANTVGAIQIVERRPFGQENALLRVKFYHANGTTTHEVVLLRLQKEGWRRDLGSAPGGVPQTPGLPFGR